MFVSSLISSKVAPVAHSGSHFASGAHTAVWQLLPQLLPPLQLVKTKPWTPSAATSWSFLSLPFLLLVERCHLDFCFSATLTSTFATTATTIVSGAIAERANLQAYMVFSFTNILTYCFPAHWVWSKHGWLKKIGVVDVGGASPVHLTGGIAGLVG